MTTIRFNAILIVDDNEDDRYLLARMIRRAGITDEILEAEDGLEALQMFQRCEALKQDLGNTFPPALVFVDINMPRMDGFEFLDHFRELRSSSALRSVVMMMFTSSSRDEDRRRATDYDFVKGFITKLPRDGEDLIAQIAQAGILE